jgi:group I intron endonuclease
MKIIVDLDGTICTQEKKYINARPCKYKIKRVNNLFRKGHTIIYWTSRGQTSGVDYEELTRNQLKEWGCLYSELKMNKPSYDLFIDNRAVNSSELSLKLPTVFIGIYKIESKIKPERIYIGSSIDIDGRWVMHRSDLLKNKHSSIKLQRHYNKYGADDLLFSIIVECNKEDLLRHEQFFIDSYNPYFNVCKVAGSSLGIKRSAETIQKLKDRKGKISEETRQRLRDSHKGIIPSEETRKKRSESMMGKNKGNRSWNKGRKQSPELVKKRTDTMKRNRAIRLNSNIEEL